MDFDAYQERAWRTAIYPNKGIDYVYPILGLTGEAGEVAEKVKKVIRDDGGVFTEEKLDELKRELGDVLWYVGAICSTFDILMSDVAEQNLQKLALREAQNLIKGSGDNRELDNE